MKYNRRPGPFRDRFWSKVQKGEPDQCWLWKGGIASNGYGQIKEGAPSRKMISAHRASFILTNGRIPEGKVICHRCDNKLCVNPNHLFAASQGDNIQDAIAKGRYVGGKVHRVLSSEQAIEIKRLLDGGHLTHAEIGERFGVKRQVITEIARGRTYNSEMEQKHVLV